MVQKNDRFCFPEKFPRRLAWTEFEDQRNAEPDIQSEQQCRTIEGEPHISCKRLLTRKHFYPSVSLLVDSYLKL